MQIQPATGVPLPAPAAPRAHVPAHRRVVAIGGGTGLPIVLRGLNHAAGTPAYPPTPRWLTALVTVMDDGGSSGRLRDTLGMLPPGDIRNCLAALASGPSALAAMLHDRLPSGCDMEHPLGNLLLAALTSLQGDFVRAIDSLGDLIGARGRVLPATLENVHLRASFEDGSLVRGESAIAARRGRIRRLTLDRAVRPLPDAIEALVNADLIVVGPGSLYTSLIPNLLVDGVAATISAVQATRVYVANLMTEPGETDNYSLADHLAALCDHTGHELFDYVPVNRTPLSASAVARYAEDGSEAVRGPQRNAWTDRSRIVTSDLAVTIASGELRHDPAALGFGLLALAGARRTH
ncbi:MAG: uridine diphosphate-N-acetylglucosamine-binding protein YvcK [Acidobacteria bacterium]|nr:uridine diphosphate-N-acetylglucosamine-binding protein YvcK [Acidobacteriota bacterium]